MKHIVLPPVNKFKTAINRKQLSLPEMQGDSYGNTGCQVFKRGVKNWKYFLPKNQLTQRKLSNFENWCDVEVSKIRHRFRK